MRAFLFTEQGVFVQLTFGDIDLAPSEYVVIVKDREAFEAAQPEFSGLLAGEYSGSLNNAGEKLELRDAAEKTISEFFGTVTYDQNLCMLHNPFFRL